AVTTVLNKLIQKNILQRDKINKYMFTHRVYAEFSDQVEYIKDKVFNEIQARAMILDYLNENEYIRRAEVEKLCGFSATTSKRVLNKMRDANEIKLVGKGSASRYEEVKQGSG